MSARGIALKTPGSASDVRLSLLRHALRWLVSGSLDLTSAHRVDDVKRLGELAVTADLLERLPRTNAQLVPRAFPRRLLSACWTALARGETILTFVDRDSAGGLFVTAYPPFFHRGFRNPGLERALRRVLSTTEYHPVDLAILVEASQRRLGGALGWPRGPNRPWPARWTRAEPTVRDVYLLAHAVFYETDFGRTPQRLRRADRRALTRRLPGLFDRFCRTGQFDVLAEVAIVSGCIGHPVPPAVWKALRSAQHRNGTLSFSRRRHRTMRDQHTTLVAIIAAVVCCGDGAPEDRDDTSHRPRQNRPARDQGR